MPVSIGGKCLCQPIEGLSTDSTIVALPLMRTVRGREVSSPSDSFVVILGVRGPLENELKMQLQREGVPIEVR
jgi:hypothetical protein